MFSECMAKVWLSVSCYLLLELQGVFHLPLEQSVVSRQEPYTMLCVAMQELQGHVQESLHYVAAEEPPFT